MIKILFDILSGKSAKDKREEREAKIKKEAFNAAFVKAREEDKRAELIEEIEKENAALIKKLNKEGWFRVSAPVYTSGAERYFIVELARVRPDYNKEKGLVDGEGFLYTSKAVYAPVEFFKTKKECNEFISEWKGVEGATLEEKLPVLSASTIEQLSGRVDC